MSRERLNELRIASTVRALSEAGLNAEQITERLVNAGEFTTRGKFFTSPNVRRVMRKFGIEPALKRRPRVNPPKEPDALSVASPDPKSTMLDDLQGWVELLAESRPDVSVKVLSAPNDDKAIVRLIGSIPDLHALMASLVVGGTRHAD